MRPKPWFCYHSPYDPDVLSISSNSRVFPNVSVFIALFSEKFVFSHWSLHVKWKVLVMCYEIKNLVLIENMFKLLEHNPK